MSKKGRSEGWRSKIGKRKTSDLQLTFMMKTQVLPIKIRKVKTQALRRILGPVPPHSNANGQEQAI